MTMKNKHMKKLLKGSIVFLVVIIAVGSYLWYVDDKTGVRTQLSQEETQELKNLVFTNVKTWLKIDNPKIDDVVTIEEINASSTAAKGKWIDIKGYPGNDDYGVIHSDWIAWRMEGGAWEVVPGGYYHFDCSDLDRIPPRFDDFFRAVIYGPTGERTCAYPGI